jgi:hypothetical protein
MKKIYRQKSGVKNIQWHVKSQSWRVCGRHNKTLGYTEDLTEAQQMHTEYLQSIEPIPEYTEETYQSDFKTFKQLCCSKQDAGAVDDGVEATPLPPSLAELFEQMSVYDKTPVKGIMRLKEEIRLNHRELKHKPYRVRHHDCVGFVDSLSEAELLLKAFRDTHSSVHTQGMAPTNIVEPRRSERVRLAMFIHHIHCFLKTVIGKMCIPLSHLQCLMSEQLFECVYVDLTG